MRWKLKLAEYEYEIKYKLGKKNKNADVLSRNPIDEIKNVYLLAKRARSSSESSGEHKKIKTSHSSFKRLTRESDGSGNPAPHKKIRPDEPFPYINTDSDIDDSPKRKFLRTLDESDSGSTTESYYETDYNTDPEKYQKGEKRKHESSSNHEQRRRRRR